MVPPTLIDLYKIQVTKQEIFICTISSGGKIGIKSGRFFVVI